MANLEPMMEGNFLEYASYVIIDRAIPDIRDGCKPVQRRILQTLGNVDDPFPVQHQMGKQAHKKGHCQPFM